MLNIIILYINLYISVKGKKFCTYYLLKGIFNNKELDKLVIYKSFFDVNKQLKSV